MIKFFRKIRQRSLTENKFGKYLLYAVGEILLVVIGILIALQVDNWNGKRKLRAVQQELLEDLRDDLIESREELEKGLALNKFTVSQYRIIMDAIVNDDPGSAKIDSAATYLPNWHSPFFTSTTYESLKSNESNIIENDQLRKQISNLYDQHFVFLQEDYDKNEWSIQNTIKIQIINRYLWFKDENLVTLQMIKPGVNPVDFERMKSDPEFIHLVSLLILTRNGGINEYEKTVRLINDVINSIVAELEHIKPSK
jgi:hypothetical protein